MTTWSMQLHPNNIGEFPPNKIKRILEKWKVVGVGGDGDDSRRFQNEAKVGDVVLIRSGATLLAFVELASEPYDNNISDEECWFDVVRDVKVIADSPERLYDEYKALYGKDPTEGLRVRGTFCKILDSNVLRFIQFWLEREKGKVMIGDKISLLKRSKQIVFTGAPGTGKTYLAKQIAQMMILEHVVEKEEELTETERKTLEMRMGFCQFHPSMDYTDFVEGLRPREVDRASGQIGFELLDGIFKEFCRRALQALTKEPDRTKPKPYVFIIDEINRGDIAKIFGELFFSIDPDYRGEKGKIRTQYYNLIDDKDVFKEFFVPENVFIIGTMNDIDRGVESMDFAIRRRFAWREIQPADTQGAILRAAIKDAAVLKRATNRMNNLNRAIAKDSDLGPAFQIGAAYFAKLEGDNFNELWQDRLYPLLHEYVRGQEDVKNRLTTFKAAFDNEQASSENSEEPAES